jgi:L-threonylcarbamoyladenylate synthase
MVRVRLEHGEASGPVLAPAIAALRDEGIVAFPTETFYGLAVDPRSARAVRSLFALKGRGLDKPLPLIAASDRQLEEVAIMTPLARRLAARCWPGPLTLIVPATPALCPEVHLGTGRIAVRVPDSQIARALAEGAGHPVTSTSANISGRPPASDAEQVVETLGNAISVLIDAGPTAGTLPSTIVDATGADPVLVRTGVIPWERVLEFLH